MVTAAKKLEQSWGRPAGFVGWLSAVNHRTVGQRYVVTAFTFFILAGILALVMRVQLAQPDMRVLSPGAYNQMFTMHGTAMMFLFAVPIVEGFGIYLVPLMIGARDMAFPRLNAFGYWIYLIAGITLFISFIAGVAPDGGWFNYVPLTGPGFSPGIGIDYWVTMITFLEVAALVASVEMIVTIFKMRAPGMTISRMPLFVWSMLVTSFMIVFAMPPLMVVSVLLALDRIMGAHFFNVAAGGQPLLWQHLFWIFGHPDVYIIFIPALGILASVVPTSVRRPIVGYVLIATSLVAIGFLSFGLWVHHMFTAGLPLLGMSFFAVASMMITIPSGIQIFALIATIWTGRLRLRTHTLFAIGFIVLFIAGGFTGVMVASVPFDKQVHDTYFVVAHFHYVLIGGVVFPLFAGFYYWFPKVTGRLLSETLGRFSFWIMFVGFNVAFFPMHIIGFQGMPRRVYTYLPGLGWDNLNLVSTIGAFALALGVLFFLVNVAFSLLFGRKPGDNPWDAGTLEWATSSPPPLYNFATIPIVSSRDPLWQGSQAWPAPGESQRAVADLADPPAGQREMIGSTMLTAEPESRVVLPGPTLWPLWLALAVSIAFIGSMVTPLLVPVGALLSYVAILGWTWPTREERAT